MEILVNLEPQCDVLCYRNCLCNSWAPVIPVRVNKGNVSVGVVVTEVCECECECADCYREGELV
jgi:hypothetical protein